MLAEAFSMNLFNTVETLEELYEFGHLPEFADNTEKKRFRVDYTFSKYLNTYNRDFFERVPLEQGSIAYWLRQLPTHLLQRSKIISSQNDFLNTEVMEKWSDLYNISLIRPNGGHSAIMTHDSFFDALEQTLINFKNL